MSDIQLKHGLSMNAEFRAWDIRKNTMVYDALNLSPTGQLVTVNPDYFNSPFSFFDGCVWMQYSTLNDKDGIKIFAGDVIELDKKWADAIGAVRTKCLVGFADGSFMFARGEDPNYFDTYLSLTVGTKHCKVIGNIYETPTILELKDDSNK